MTRTGAVLFLGIVVVLIAGCGREKRDFSGAGVLHEYEQVQKMDTLLGVLTFDSMNAAHCMGMLRGIMAMHYRMPRHVRLFCVDGANTMDSLIVALQDFAAAEPQSLRKDWGDFIIDAWRWKYPCAEQRDYEEKQ